MSDPTSADLYRELLPALRAREAAARTALQVVVAAITERHPDARGFLVQVRPDGAGFQLVSIATADDVHPWRRTAGDHAMEEPVDVLAFATTLLGCEHFFAAEGAGRYWVDLAAARAHLSGPEPKVVLVDLPAGRSVPTTATSSADPQDERGDLLQLEPVVKRFTLRRGIRAVRLGRAVVPTDGWLPRADAFRVLVEDGKLVVEVTAQPLDRDDSRDVALTFGVFAPGDDRGHMADDPEHGPGGSWSNQTMLGQFTVGDVEYTVVAEFNED